MDSHGIEGLRVNFVNSFVTLRTNENITQERLSSPKLQSGAYILPTVDERVKYLYYRGYSVPFEVHDNHVFLFTSNVAYALDVSQVLGDVMNCSLYIDVIKPDRVTPKRLELGLLNFRTDPLAGVTFNLHGRASADLDYSVSISTNGVTSFDMTNCLDQLHDLMQLTVSLLEYETQN